MSVLKKMFLKLYYFGNLSKEKTDIYQTKIRDAEWNAVLPYIKEKGKFLDVGCGTGNSMRKAQRDKQCECYGIDPDPGAHGVGRKTEGVTEGLNIVQGFSEQLPYEDNFFDVVYSSHVLEHVNDEKKSLEEMYRVLKPNGVLIIGMPTASMSWVSLITETLFTTHQRFFNIILSPFKRFINLGDTSFIHLFIPPSHSNHRAKTILFDLFHYRISNWKKIVSGVFRIDQTLTPAFYPYPQYLQLFSLHKNKWFSSSVFFICNKDS